MTNATTISCSLPGELAERAREVMKLQEQSPDEFLEEAVRRYVVACEWRELFRYGEERARALGIKPEDVMDLVEEYRAETNAT